MMDYINLNSNNIYTLPLDTTVEREYLVYAPLSKMFFRLKETDVERLELASADVNSNDFEAVELLHRISRAEHSQKTITSKQTVSELHKLTILPTYSCNFKCSYCFSAQGRSKKTLERNKALAIIDFFIDHKRTSLNDLWLAILGGGEPFLASELTTEIIEYAREKAIEQGFHLGIGLTTNGSIYDASLAKVMVDNNVNLGVSFEVLKDIQEQQRGNYGNVVATINHYLSEGVDVAVKSIITPLNVNLLEEMVIELHRIMPDVRKYKLQIVEDARIFSNIKNMKSFYDNFTHHFFEAQRIGFEMGIDVYVLTSKMTDMLVEHYCGGEMCLNPSGGLTVCHRYSSPEESGYESFCFGHIDNNGNVKYDRQRFSRLINHDIYHKEKCFKCFAKWHCGGGCLAQCSIYDEDHQNVICDWTRDFIFKTLLRQLFNAEKNRQNNN